MMMTKISSAIFVRMKNPPVKTKFSYVTFATLQSTDPVIAAILKLASPQTIGFAFGANI